MEKNEFFLRTGRLSSLCREVTMPGTPLSEDKRNHSSAGAEGNSFNSRLRKISEALEKI